MKYGFFSSCTCLLVIGLLFLFSCKKQSEKSCFELIDERFNDERVEVIGGDRFNFVITKWDTTVFSYSGYDTLIYKVTDSTSGVDTVCFIGNGKNHGYEDLGVFMIHDDCTPRQYAETMNIIFIPTNMEYSNLFFSLKAGDGTSTFRYAYDGFAFYELTEDVDWIYYAHFMKIYQTDGMTFYNASYFSTSSPLGDVEFYINKEKQVFLFIINGKKKFLRIN